MPGLGSSGFSTLTKCYLLAQTTNQTKIFNSNIILTCSSHDCFSDLYKNSNTPGQKYKHVNCNTITFACHIMLFEPTATAPIKITQMLTQLVNLADNVSVFSKNSAKANSGYNGVHTQKFKTNLPKYI